MNLVLIGRREPVGERTATSNWAARHRIAYALAVFFACGLAYFIVLQAFLSIPQFNTDTQIRPASGVGPVLGLFFGLPGILGCAVGNLVADSFTEGDPLMLGVYFAIQVAYNAVPYVLWYAVFRKKAQPFPRMDSTNKVLAYIAIMALDAVLVTLLLMPFEAATFADFDIHAIRALNNIIFLIYLGIPLLVLLDRAPTVPLAPAWIRATYRRRTHMNLSQRAVIGFTALSAAISIGATALSYGPYFVEGNVEFADLIGFIYEYIAGMTFVTFVPLLVVLHVIETRFTRPVEVLTAASQSFVEQVAARDAAMGKLAATAIDEPGIKPKYEMRDLFNATNKMRADMVDYVNRLSAATAERERTAAELDIARQIQLGAVPHEFTSFTERYRIDIDASMLPAREVGGDFYDVFDVGDQGICFVIGDVSGKGVPASLFMMRAQSLIKESVLACDDLGAAFTLVNRRLCEHNEALLFVTAFACVLDTATGHVSYVNAGHNPPSMLREGVRSYLRVKPGLVLGAMDVVTYREASMDFKPGDELLLYTDGVTEASNAEGELFGEDRLAAVLAAYDAAGRTGLVARISRAVDEFAAGTPQADDITMLAFAWNLPVEALVLPPEDCYLDNLFAFLRPLCEREGTTQRMEYGLMLVCEEIFVNICHYGFPGDQPKFPVRFEAAVDEQNRRLHLTISDQGVAYNPLSFEPEKVGLDKDNRIGGLGILLVKENVDDIRYERTEGKNILRITKGFV